MSRIDVVRLGPEGRSELVMAARRHRVLPVLDQAVASVDGFEPELVDELLQARQAALVSHLRYLAELQRVSSALDDLGVAWVVTKGPVLAELAYPRPDWRPYGDLDIVVDPLGFQSAVEELEARDYTLVERNWTLLREQGKGELNLSTASGGAVDLHWSPLYNHAMRQQFNFGATDLLARRRRQTLGGVDAWVPDPTDHLLHVLAHAALSGAHRLIWVLDVHFAVRAGEIDWAALASRAQATGLAPAASIMLTRTDRVVGLPGDEWRRCTISTPWVVGVDRLDRLRPMERWIGGGPSLKLVARSTRSSSGASVAQLLRHVASALGELRDPSHPWRQNAKAPRSANEFARTAGSDVDRARYFREIASSGA